MGTDNDILNGNGGNETLNDLAGGDMLSDGNGHDRGTARLKRYHHWEKRCRFVQRWFAADIIFEEDGNNVLTGVWARRAGKREPRGQISL
jgi:hypothetical protein